MKSSIRRRLLLILLCLFAIAWLAVTGATYITVRDDVEDLLDAQLAQSAQVLLNLAAYGIDKDEGDEMEVEDLEATIAKPSYAKAMEFHVWRGKKVFLHSEGAPDFPLPERPGYDDMVIKGQKWRILSLTAPEKSLAVQVGVRTSLYDGLRYEMIWETLYPLLLALPFLAATLWIGVGRGLRPLQKIADQVALLTPSNLQPVDIHEIPYEISGLTEKLNALLLRLSEAIEMEKLFTADAAHEMRTPLASLKTHAQVALRSTDTEEHRQALRQVILGVDRVTHLVEQLLTLARLDRTALEGRFAPVDLPSLAEKVLTEMAPAALDKGIELSLDEQSRGEVTGDPAGLAIMLRNLVDNAISYIPASGSVAVAVATEEDAVSLTVTDTGPGIPVEERERVFDRFYRSTGNHVTGCGLGLSIVRRIAELHKAVIKLKAGPSGIGLQVRINFPRVSSA